MATFEELFPDAAATPKAPFAPIQPQRVSDELQQVTARTRGIGSPTGDDQFMTVFSEMLGGPQQQQAGDAEWKDYGKSIVAGVGDLGAAAAGAGEYVARKAAGAGNTPFEQGAMDVASAFAGGRRASTQFSDDWIARMTPEAQQRAAREIFTLDPNQTLFQGGPGEVLSSISLKMSRSLPSTAVTLLPGALMMRAGLGRGSIAYLGASEGGLSLGSIAANIATEIEQAPESELLESQRYTQLRQTMDEASARQALIAEAQGYAPVVGGLIVGAISAAAGRYLEPVFTGAPGGLLSRAGRGFTSEGLQETGQSGAEQVAQNYAAQLYDTDRSLGEGVAEAMGQGAIVGGAMGGVTMAAIGPRRRALTPPPKDTDLTASQAPAGGGGATFESIFGTGGETPGAPAVGEGGQTLLDVGQVDVDRQAALNARRDGMIKDMFEPEAMSPAEEQAAYLQSPWPVQQGELELPEATRDVVPVAPEAPYQQDLGLRMRERGQPPVAIPAGTGVPNQSGLPPEPPGPPAPPPGGKGKKARAAQQVYQQQLREFELSQRQQGGDFPPTEPTGAQFDLDDQAMGPDQPSAEPLADLEAQLRDLADPVHPRQAVYLSRDNLSVTQQEQLPNVGIALPNFDGKGGTLIAKDETTAQGLQELRALVDEGGLTMQELLGYATGSGGGKPVGGGYVVQQRDYRGNVTRESMVATPEEADTLADDWEESERPTAILSPEQAIKRRNMRLAQERGLQVRTQSNERVRDQLRRAGRRENLSDAEVERMATRAGRVPKGRADIARRMRLYLRRLHGRAMRNSVAGFPHPDVVRFADEKAGKTYAELRNQLQEEISKGETGNPELAARRIIAHLRTNTATTQYDQVLRAVGSVLREEIRDSQVDADEAEEADLWHMQPRRDLEARSPLKLRQFEPDRERIGWQTKRTLDAMSDSAVQELFVDALESRASRTQRKGSNASKANRLLSQDTTREEGVTVEEEIKKTTTRSEKVKAILREARELQNIASRAGSSAHTRGFAMSEKARHRKESSLTMKGKDDKTSKSPRQKRVQGVLQPMNILSGTLPREMSADQLQAFKAKLRTAYEQLRGAVDRLEKSRTGSFMRQMGQQSRKLNELAGVLPIDKSKMTEAQKLQQAEIFAARARIRFARQYLRNFEQYGKMILQVRPRSAKALQEIERFNKVIADLMVTPGDKNFVEKLYRIADAEQENQTRLAQEATSTRLPRNKSQRVLQAQRQRARLLERTNQLRRLHEDWQKNPAYMMYVEPVMHKIIGFVSGDPVFIQQQGRGLPHESELELASQTLRGFHLYSQLRSKLYAPLRAWFEGWGFKFDGPRMEPVIPAKLERIKNQRWGEGSTEWVQRVKAERAANRAARDSAIRRQAERDRLAALSPAQRAREEFNLARKVAREVEKDRRAGMSYEQRRLAESLDRRGTPGLALEILNPTANMSMVRKAATAIASRLEAAVGTYDAPKLQDVLGDLKVHLPDTHPLRPLVDRLHALNMNVSVMYTSKPIKGYGEYSAERDGYQLMLLNREKFAAIREKGEDPAPGFLHTILHEATHAATAGELKTNGPLRAALASIMRQVRVAAKDQGVSLKFGKDDFYGIRDNDVFEFVAEAFTNDQFQEVLKQIQIEPGHSVWSHIIELVRKLLGLEPKSDSALDLILSTADSLFTGRVESTSGVKEIAKYALDDAPTRTVTSDIADRILQSVRVSDDMRNRAKDFKRAVTEDAPRGLLPVMTMEQIRDFYSSSFGGAAGALANYMKAFFRRNAEVSRLMESADALSRRWTALNEQKPENSLELSRVMSEASQFGIHPDRGVSEEGNKHLTTPEQKQHHGELAKRFRALPNEWRVLYEDVRQYYRKTLEHEAALATLNAIRAGIGKDEEFGYTEADVKRLRFDTQEGLEKAFGDSLTQEARDTIVTLANTPQLHTGPYFPLSRYGDYVVTAEREIQRKTFTDGKSARAWMQEKRANDPTLSISLEKQADDRYEARVVEREVRMVETRTEADEAHATMVARYGAEHVSQPQLKAVIVTSGAAIQTGRGLQTILNNLEGNKAAQNAIKEFYLRSLSDRSFRKHEIKRQNRRGVDYDLQHRAFGSYAKSASYYSAQLQYGWQMADALAKMQTFAKDVANGEASSNLSSIELSKVTREIAARDQMMASQAEPSKLVRAGTSLSQFMLLTSPSYWLINATQPYMVTLPWLAAKHGVAEATAALGRAQQLIMHPIVSQMGQSWLGAKALRSKIAAENAFNVLPQVEAQIKERGGARAQEYLDMLRDLKRDSIIDLSFVSEIRDIAEGANAGLKQKVLDASRIMSHLTEVNNRIMTALAAYDLARDRGLNYEASREFAHQAVSVTQFNYSSGNAPRLFSYRGPLGQMGPLIFQFMKYPQHIYALLIDNFRHLASSDRMERAVARKTLIGLGLTHMAAGGIMGVMLQPIKWAVGLTLAAFGDDDEPYTVANAMSGESFDRLVREYAAELFGTDMGELVSGGLPRAIGVDVSDRMSLGSLYYIDLKTDTTESTIGSLAKSFGGPLVGIIGNAGRGVQYLQQGDFEKAIESVSPKGMKDMVKAFRYTNEGLTNMRGEQIMNAKDLSPMQLFAQSLGFTPSSVSEHYAKASAVKEAQLAAEDRHDLLLNKYLSAKPDERGKIMQDIREFNRRKPASAITMSQLLRGAARRKERELRMQRYGVDLRGDDVTYAEAGAAYN